MDNGIQTKLLRHDDEETEGPLTERVWTESKKIWRVALPGVISRVCAFGTIVVTQSFMGHISDMDLAAYALVQTLSVRFVNGILLGMSSATETLCGQAFGAGQNHMMGIYLQRSWIVDFFTLTVLLPIFIFATQLYRLIGEDDAIAVRGGYVSLWFIPFVYNFVFSLTIQMYLQAQLKNMVIAWLSIFQFGIHIPLSWLLVYKLGYGVPGAMIALSTSSWFLVIGEFIYIFGGWCPHSWKGFTVAAFKDLVPVVKLSISSGVMVCIKLENSNYSLWRTTIISALETFDLESFVLAPNPPAETRPVQPATTPPTTEPNPDYQIWKKKDRYVLLWLKSTLSERSLAIVARASTSRLAWTAIEKTFQAQTRARRMVMKGELQSLSKGSLPMIEYIERKRAIADALAENLNPISTEDLIGYILHGLDSSYGPFTAAFLVQGEDSTVDDLIGLLLQEEARLEQDHLRQQLQTPPAPNSSIPLALHVNRPSPRYTSNPRPNSNNFYSGASATSRPSDTRRRRPHCQLCNRPGHEAINCWHRNNQIDFPSRGPNPRESTSRQAHVAQTSQSTPSVDPNWYLDSGATDHVTSDPQNLHTADAYQGNDHLQVGNGNNLSISHIGSTSLHSLKLPSVLVVPRITKNLLSISRLTFDNDVYLNFRRTHCAVKNLQGKTLLRGDVRHGLYCLPSNKSPNNSIPPMALTGTRTSIHGWHMRLAHPHEPILRRLLSSFQLPVSSHKFPTICDACQLGKSHRLHLPTSHVASSKPFDLIYTDVWGPSPYFSINGNRYFVLFIDDCSKFIWIYFLSQKSQVLNTFKLFHTMVQTQFNTTIKCVQSDWGGEYRNVSSYLATLGIDHRLSCPYTPEQNGAVERRNRVIIEKGLSLLAHSHLPHTFWEHAFKTATYLHNRTITPLLSYTSPYQILYSKTPDYAFLKTFGCLCYPFLRPYHHHKIDFRSLPCIFIGYSPSHKGYMCYHQPTSRIYISRHVVFNEDIFPYTPPPCSVPSSSATPSFTPSTLLQTASHLTSPSQPPPPAPPSPPSPLSNTPLPTHTPSTSAPHYTNSTISSRAKETRPSTSHSRPAANSLHPMTTRARTNSLKPKSFLTTTMPSSLSEPTSFLKATRDPCWQQAMQLEFDALMRNRTWSLVPCPTNVNVVGCKWLYRLKRRSDGTIDRHKARLVAQGFSQEAGVDYFETFSPVIKPTTIRLVLSLAISKGWCLRQLDINNAFLNGDLHEAVYMRQPKGFEDPNKPHHVCKLHKALYGLKQAPRAWFTKLKQFLLTNGFRACHSDTSLFVHHSSSAIIYILVYVDDLIITGTSTVLIQKFINHLHKAFALKDLGDLQFFLGIQIHRTSHGLTMSQEHYVQTLLQRTKMTDAKPISTPADTACRLTQQGDPFSDPKLYRQVVGSLQYATITRPDIAYAVNRVCQYMHSPTTLHWQAVKRILRYLNGTKDQCLHFTPSNPQRLTAFSDAGWISDKDDSRSQYGYAIFHGSNLISWTSRKQRVVARSSTEAEYRSLAYTAAELIWIQQLLADLHAPLSNSPHILCDNVGAIFMTKNPVIRTRSKHIALDFHFIREQVESRDLSISSVSSVDQLADIFTKALHKERLLFLRHKLQIRPAFQLAGGLELWYNAVLVLLAGYMANAEVAISAFSICLNINAWEFMISLGFLGAACVRVANELGRGNAKAAKFSIKVLLGTSIAIGTFFFVLCLVFGKKIAYFFTDDERVADTVSDLSLLLSFSVLLNSIYPVLSGVAVGAGMQGIVAIINLVCYYLIGIPLGALLGYLTDLQVKGIWIGMIGGIVTQTLALMYLTWRTDWDDQVKKAGERLNRFYVKSSDNTEEISN